MANDGQGLGIRHVGGPSALPRPGGRVLQTTGVPALHGPVGSEHRAVADRVGLADRLHLPEAGGWVEL
jgi:hypothetical protein